MVSVKCAVFSAVFVLWLLLLLMHQKKCITTIQLHDPKRCALCISLLAGPVIRFEILR